MGKRTIEKQENAQTPQISTGLINEMIGRRAET
jgi:hypothetical protein